MIRVEERQAVRAILLTPEAEVLLLRLRLPDVPDPFWVAPGGGLESGETLEEALRRELKEELGLTELTLGPLVWLRQHTFNFGGRRILQHERYHVVNAPKFKPRMSDAVEAAVVERFRWWPVRELFGTQERMTPLSLARIVDDYLKYGAPTGPLEVEVLVD